MSTNLANHSNTSRQIQETSRNVGYTAPPTPGEAASPWQATYTVQHDNLKGPPSRGGRTQSRMAPGMQHACLGRTRLSLDHAVASHRRPAPVGADLRTLDSNPPATQHPLGDVEGWGEPPTPLVCTALSFPRSGSCCVSEILPLFVCCVIGKIGRHVWLPPSPPKI